MLGSRRASKQSPDVIYQREQQNFSSNRIVNQMPKDYKRYSLRQLQKAVFVAKARNENLDRLSCDIAIPNHIQKR